MVKFFCSKMPNPSPWKSTRETDERKVIDAYFNDHIKIWDADNCGEVICYFAFDTGTTFKLSYSWWCDYGSDEYIKDEVVVEEIERATAIGICADRDWMNLHKT